MTLTILMTYLARFLVFYYSMRRYNLWCTMVDWLKPT